MYSIIFAHMFTVGFIYLHMNMHFIVNVWPSDISYFQEYFFFFFFFFWGGGGGRKLPFKYRDVVRFTFAQRLSQSAETVSVTMR